MTTHASPRSSRSLAALAAVLIATLVCAAALASTSATASSGPYARVAQLIAFMRQTSTGPSTVWVAGPTGGNARMLGQGDQPALSPNGAMVAAVRQSGTAVVLYSTTGGPKHTFATSSAFPAALAWSPDSHYIAVSLDSTATNGVTGAGLAVIDTTTDTFKVIVKGEISGASFAVNGSDTIVYGLSSSLSLNAPLNLHTILPNGTAGAQLTHNGNSLNPVWGAKGIVFDRETRRGPDANPANQLWLLNGTHLQQLTHQNVPQLLSGLVPIAVSANGNRLLVEQEGEDTSDAWTLQISPLQLHQVKAFVQGGGISSDGSTLLVDSGAFENVANAGTVETIPFGANSPVHKLTRGAFPTWNL